VTVTPLHDRSGRSRRSRRSAPSGTTSAAVVVSGVFPAPTGGVGTFRGYYRFERLVTDQGHAAIAGVFAGALVDADEDPVGTGSRRHTAAAVVVRSRSDLVAQVGPVEVNVLGFPVLVAPFEVTLPQDLPAGAEAARWR
jgi:hypothetical protein